MKADTSMDKLYPLNHLKWFARLPAKTALLLLTVLIVCFPNPARLFRHVNHWMNMNALVDPDAKSIQPWLAELRPTLHDDLTPPQVLKRVEQFVYDKVPYDYDWNTWGVVDYLPTADEVVEMGREDCDGRAVVAASMLKNLGYKAELVTDYAHMWVKTDIGETMSPGKTKVVVATEKGLEIKLRGLLEIPKAWMFGVSIFPLLRELIVAIVLWLMLIKRGGGKLCNISTFAVFIGGLLILRAGGQNYYKPNYWLEGLGLTVMESTMVVLILWSRKNRKVIPNPVTKNSTVIV